MYRFVILSSFFLLFSWSVYGSGGARKIELGHWAISFLVFQWSWSLDGDVKVSGELSSDVVNLCLIECCIVFVGFCFGVIFVCESVNFARTDFVCY